MNPARRDLSAWRGNSAEFTFRVTTIEGDTSVISGDSYKMVIEADTVITSVAASAVDPITGEFTVNLTPAQTRALTANNHMPNYELVRVREAQETTIMFGNLIVGGTINHV